MQQTFEAKLVARGPKGAWTHLPIPFDVQKVFGKKSRVPVVGTINGFPFRNSLMPEGGGKYSLTVAKDLQAGAKVTPGDMVRVTLKLDEEKRIVECPPELLQVFADDAAAGETFRQLSYSHQKEYADWIASAKKPETRTARAAKALTMIRAKKHLR